MQPTNRRRVEPMPVQQGKRVTAVKKRNRKKLILPFAIIVAVLVLLVLVFPKEPLGRAVYTKGTDSGKVDRTAGTPDSQYDGLVISEVMPANKSAVPDEEGNYPDWVELTNTSDHPINMEGVGLSDRGDSIRFLFPAVTLEAGGSVVVFCSNTNRAEPGSDFHAKFKLSSVGETVYVFDPNAFRIDSVTYPILNSDTSYALLDGKFEETQFFSPGYPNGEEGYKQYLAHTRVENGELVINEVMADAVTGLRDEDDELSDWVELLNTTDHAVSLDRYAFTNNERKPLKWRFPKGATVAPGGTYLVFCSGKDRRDDPAAIPHANFRISAEHDTLILSDAHGRLVDRVTIDNLAKDCSFGRDPSGQLTVFQTATPGLPNTRDGANTMDMHLRAMNPSGVYITEVMASNDSTQTVDDKTFTDWVEIFNATQSSVDISNYGLSDNIGRARKWQFPYGTVLSPGEKRIVLCDGQGSAAADGRLHTSFRILRAGGEIMCLSDPTGRVLDKMNLPLIPTNVSYGRTAGMAGFFYYDTPTPGQENGTGFLGYASAPVFSTDPGLHEGTVRLTIAAEAGSTVFYTTDGSIPTEASKPYNGETLEMNFTTVIRARAFLAGEGLHPSTITTGTYFVNAYHSLPVVSVVCDPDVLWNPLNGLLVTGDDVVKEPGKLPFKNTIYRQFGKIAREGHIEFYQLDGKRLLNQDMQFELSGAYSLDMPQKSFKLRSKSLYGAKTFDAKLFDDREYTEFKGLVLRNSGNDSMWTRMQDGFQSRLLDRIGTSVIHQAWKPVAVYLNGVYWGHMNLRERVDRFFIAQHEGMSLRDASQMDIVEANSKTKYGTNRDYKAMIKKIKASSPKNNPDDLQYILDNVDVDNYFEYLAFEMFFGNSDPGNIRYYRLKKPGAKWKWILYDLDYGLYMSTFDSPKSYTKLKGMGQKKINNTIFLKLLEVPEYKDMFLNKLGWIFKTFTTDYMMETLEATLAEIEPEMQLHWARWGEENDTFVITEVPTTADGALRYWKARVNRLRNIVKKRPNLLWGYIQDAFSLSNEQMIHYFGERPVMPADAV